MKNFKYIIGLLFLLVGVISCQDEDFEVGSLVAPSNINIVADIVGADNANPNGDGSGKVNFAVSADNALSYHFIYNDETRLAKNGKITYNFSTTGLHTYSLTVIAYGKGGVSSSETIQVDVLALYEPPADLLQMLVGDSSKTWRIKAEANGHFGLGPVGGTIPTEWYGAGPNEKATVGMYDDRYIFNKNGTFTHITNSKNDSPNEDPTGTVFGRKGLIDEIGTGGEVNGDDVLNLPYDDYTESWSLTAPEDVETLSLSGLGFIGYYTGGNHSYTIVSRSANEMLLKTTDGNGQFDWWFILTSEEETNTNQGFVSQYNNLVWADEFDADGAPDPAKWTYDLGAGGWGNNELQNYTNNADNVIVDGGLLKITAKSQGSGDVYYFDEVKLADAGGNAQSTIQDFEGTAPTFTDFGGASSQVIDNPDKTGDNTTAKVGELTKGLGSEVWAGSYFDLGSALDLSTNNRITVKTWSPKANVVVRVKLENSQNSNEIYEVDANTTVANQWETLTFDFSNAPAHNFDRFVIFFDFGNSVSNYTSARIKSENLYEFTYGRVEVRAKLPVSQGTWPAIWMLGANFDTVGWPASGEIDIMEQGGQDKGAISGTLHYPAVSPGSGNTASTTLATATSEFHNYTIEWTPDVIKFIVDDQVYHEVTNTNDLPFNSDFFLILNLAMGGSLGGDVDANFTQDTLEIDYVRVYQ